VYTPVRSANAVSLTGDPNFLVVDAELPFGVPVRWEVQAYTGAGELTAVQSAPLTVTGVTKAVLSDAITGRSADVVIIEWPERRRQRLASTYVVGGRTVVVAGDRGDPESQITLLVEFDSSRDNLSALLDGATSAVVQVRQPGGYSVQDVYVAVLADVEQRMTNNGTDQRRTWVLDLAEVEAWPDTLQAKGFTLLDLANKYPSPPKTLADINAAYPSLFAIAQADLGA
jgi:hypothetical protein